ncbi:MAG TPA: DUF2752 domain-containing protein [Vicinamibacteria bacterium]|nr:DUF2752 domain-containing protein [Vicinamibacteria bacterium]
MTREPAAPHLVILAACGSILLFALLFRPVEPGDSLRIGGTPVPNVCIMKQVSGLPCPGCGLTRSLVAAANGEWARSLSHHRIGILILAYLVLQSVGRLAWLGLPRLREGIRVYCRLLDLGLVPMLLLLFLNWISTLLGGIHSGTAT